LCIPKGPCQELRYQERTARNATTITIGTKIDEVDKEGKEREKEGKRNKEVRRNQEIFYRVKEPLY